MQYQDVCRTHHIEMPHNKSTLIKLLRARFEKKPTYISYFLKIQLKYNSAFPKHSQIFQHVKLSTVSRSHRTTESKHQIKREREKEKNMTHTNPLIKLPRCLEQGQGLGSFPQSLRLTKLLPGRQQGRSMAFFYSL